MINRTLDKYGLFVSLLVIAVLMVSTYWFYTQANYLGRKVETLKSDNVVLVNQRNAVIVLNHNLYMKNQ